MGVHPIGRISRNAGSPSIAEDVTVKAALDEIGHMLENGSYEVTSQRIGTRGGYDTRVIRFHDSESVLHFEWLEGPL